MHRFVKAAIAASVMSLAPLVAYGQTVNLRVAHALAPTEPIHEAVERFAAAVNERSEGRLNISVFPSEQLGINREVYEQVRQGAPIIQVADPGFMSDYVPDFGVMNGPYLLDEPAEFQKILDSDWYANLETRSAEAGFRPLSFNYFFGNRHMLGNKPFKSPSDLSGVTMRIAPNPIWVETFAALGARGTPLPWTEVYSALSQNVVEAVEAPLGSLVGSKLQEQRKTLSLTGHFTAFLGLVMSETIFQSLDADLQKILLEESAKAGTHMTETTLSNDKKLLEQLKAEGVTVVEDIDTAAFREATAKVYDAFPAWTPGVYSQIRAILD
jgi:TRAP-type C4-dicarboxylate transport system, periplasmic component